MFRTIKPSVESQAGRSSAARRARPTLEGLEARDLPATHLGPDFNRDGYSDLVMGLPREDVILATGTVRQAGAVLIQFGSPAGVSPAGPRQLLSQSMFGRWTFGEGQLDNFGAAFTYGDFNRDGFDDLVVGSPNKDLPGRNDAGAMVVFYGSSTGLGGRAQLLTQDRLYGAGSSEAGDHFGAVLTAGDFNHDGYADLAAGVKDEDVGAEEDAGEVNVVYGTADGLGPGVFMGWSWFNQPQVWTQAKTGLSRSERGDCFGTALAVGDFNGDGSDDLAIGSPGDSYEVEVHQSDGRVYTERTIEDGLLTTIYGSSMLGLTSTLIRPWWGRESYSHGEDYQRFGMVLAAGNFDGDAYDDLAVGVPLSDGRGDQTRPDGGSIEIFYGSPIGYERWARFTQPAAAVEAGDQFGYALAVGDFNGDRIDDLAAGAPFEDIGAVADAGAVSVLYGSPWGIEVLGAKTFYQGNAGLAGVPQAGDLFGFALAAGDYERTADGRAFADLVIGVPREDVGDNRDAGAVQVVFGSGWGLTNAGQRYLTQDVLAVEVEIYVLEQLYGRQRYAARGGNFLGWWLG